MKEYMKTREHQIDIARRLIATGISKDLVEVLEQQFPELTESEDERIRKAALEGIEYLEHNLGWDAIGDTDILDVKKYLEKQKEHPKSAEVVLARAGLKPYKDGNQWCILAGDNIQEGICGFGDTIDEALYQFLMEILEKQKEQKPAEWGEEDNEILGKLQKLIILCRSDLKYIQPSEFDTLGTWLKDLPNRVALQSKQEWNEKDENVWNYFHELISFGYTEKFFFDAQTAGDMREWLNTRLKSLRPQPHWKPSEDEVRLINTTISFLKDFADKGYENAVECIDWLKSKSNGNPGK